MRNLTALRRSPRAVRIVIVMLLTVVVGLLLQIVSAPPAPQPSNLLELLRGRGGYLGQTAAPYLLVPFTVGVLCRSRVGGIVAGVLSCWVLLAGYYGWFIPGTFSAAHGGPVEQAIWLIAAVAAGSVSGLLGHAARRPGWWQIVMPLALLLEPVGWFVLLQLHTAPVLAHPQGVAGAAIEAVVGAVWLALIRRRHAAVRPAQPAA